MFARVEMELAQPEQLGVTAADLTKKGGVDGVSPVALAGQGWGAIWETLAEGLVHRGAGFLADHRSGAVKAEAEVASHQGRGQGIKRVAGCAAKFITVGLGGQQGCGRLEVSRDPDPTRCRRASCVTGEDGAEEVNMG